MPSARRIKLLLLIILVATFIILYLTTAKRATNGSPFYFKTQDQLQRANFDKDVNNALANAGDEEAKKKVRNPSPTGQDRINDAKVQAELGQESMEETLKEKLRIAEVLAKKSADDKWKAQQALARARQESPDIPGKQEDKTGAQEGTALVGDTSAKKDNKGDPIRAAEAAAKKLEEIKRSADESVVRESEGKSPVAPEKNVRREEALGPEESTNDKAEVIRQKMLRAREREQARLKAEYREQLKQKEMKRQREAGQKINAVNPEFEKRKMRKLAQQNVAKEESGRDVDKPNAEAAPTSKAPPVPTTPAELEFHRLLALSPVTIFSKSYCPYSMKAKRILTQAFDITPSPYVVELDKHALGKQIQAILFDRTRRKTVPNVIVAGKSIGGGDEIESLWEKGKLRETLKNIAGRRLVGVVENEDILKKGWSH